MGIQSLYLSIDICDYAYIETIASNCQRTIDWIATSKEIIPASTLVVLVLPSIVPVLTGLPQLTIRWCYSVTALRLAYGHRPQILTPVSPSHPHPHFTITLPRYHPRHGHQDIGNLTVEHDTRDSNTVAKDNDDASVESVEKVGDRPIADEEHVRFGSGLAFLESALDVGLGQVIEVVMLMPLDGHTGARNGEGIGEGVELEVEISRYWFGVSRVCDVQE